MPKKKKKPKPEPEPEPDEDEPVVVIPEDQEQLTEKELEEEHTQIIRAEDPNAPDNVTKFNYQANAFKVEPSISHTAVHLDKRYALIMHRESEDAKVQLAMEAQIIEKEKDVLKQLEEAAEKEEGRDADEVVEDASALRNQFNFSDRTYQTVIHPRRDVEIMTVPPQAVEFSGMATQHDIWDWYAKDLDNQEKEAQRQKDKAKNKKNKDDDSGRKVFTSKTNKKKDPLYTMEMQRSLQMVERAVNQNAFDDILMDFKFWEDESDALKPGSGSLLPLWQFSSQKARHRAVTGLCWNKQHDDPFAVALGSYDFTRQATGTICVYSLKNPSSPDFVYQTDSGVMCIDFNSTKATSLLACGLYDGGIAVFDLGKKDEKTHGYDREAVVQATINTGKHMDPVWQVRWSTEDTSGVVSFVSISTDGTMIQWSITTNELQVEELMRVKLLLKDDDADIDETDVVGQASTNCFAFSRDSSNLFVVGTEEGDIYKCSTAYTTEYLLAYEGHDLNVYGVEYNHFHSSVFLSCSADWTVKMWDHGSVKAVMSWDLNNAVCDVAWAPFSSTVFAAVTSDAKVHVFDLNQNKVEPMCEQKVIRKAKLTHIIFNPVEPIILVGDDKGSVVALKLSPNLRELTVVESHKHPKTGEMKPTPTDPDELRIWQKEELDAEIGKLQNVMDRAIQSQQASGED